MTSQAITAGTIPVSHVTAAKASPHYVTAVTVFLVFLHSCSAYWLLNLAASSLQFMFTHTDDGTSGHLNVYDMSLTSFALAVIFIRLFNTSVFDALGLNYIAELFFKQFCFSHQRQFYEKNRLLELFWLQNLPLMLRYILRTEDDMVVHMKRLINSVLQKENNKTFAVSLVN